MLPKEFKERMRILLGNEYTLFEKTFLDEEIKAIRINTTKISVEEFLKISPFELEKIPYTEDETAFM